jgi:hypothetical protein
MSYLLDESLEITLNTSYYWFVDVFLKFSTLKLSMENNYRVLSANGKVEIKIL